MIPDIHIEGHTSEVTRDGNLNEQDNLLCYMHAKKFEAFLERGLRLTRADLFTKDDHFEAEFTEEIYTLVGSMTIQDPGGATQSGLNVLKEQCNQIRRECFVSCWTKGSLENVALWRLYGRQKNAVAIKTNVGKLKILLENFIINSDTKTNFELGLCKKRIIKIEYINHHESGDYEKLLSGQDTNILHFKNIGYKFEDEVRVIFDTYQTSVTGRFGESITIKVTPEDFIEEVLVSPYACNCYFESIKELLEPYNLAGKTKWSLLKSVPGSQ